MLKSLYAIVTLVAMTVVGQIEKPDDVQPRAVAHDSDVANTHPARKFNEEKRKLIAIVAEIDQLQKPEREIVAKLIVIISDEKLYDDVRREAVQQLGRIGSKDAIQYLVDHVTLYIPKAVVKGDGDHEQTYPCSYALSKSDWRVLPPS